MGVLGGGEQSEQLRAWSWTRVFEICYRDWPQESMEFLVSRDRKGCAGDQSFCLKSVLSDIDSRLVIKKQGKGLRNCLLPLGSPRPLSLSPLSKMVHKPQLRNVFFFFLLVLCQ